MKKHYVIRFKEGSNKKEKVFEGTFEEALALDEKNKKYSDFYDLMMARYFGDGSDGFTYEEVSEEEFNECD